MPELSLLEIISYVSKSLVESKVLILLILELAILVISFIFRRLMNKKTVNRTSIIASLIVFAFYISNYMGTLIVFINNVSTRLIELIYFPTTLEYMLVMLTSFVIMGITLLSKKSHWMLKFINTSVAIIISFLFLCIIEYINVNNIAFNEFSVFTNPILMSLYEFAMGVFITWVIGLLVFKVDKIIINTINEVEDAQETLREEELITVNLPNVESFGEEEIELPKLKQN